MEAWNEIASHCKVKKFLGNRRGTSIYFGIRSACLLNGAEHATCGPSLAVDGVPPKNQNPSLCMTKLAMFFIPLGPSKWVFFWPLERLKDQLSDNKRGVGLRHMPKTHFLYKECSTPLIVHFPTIPLWTHFCFKNKPTSTWAMPAFLPVLHWRKAHPHHFCNPPQLSRPPLSTSQRGGEKLFFLFP